MFYQLCYLNNYCACQIGDNNTQGIGFRVCYKCDSSILTTPKKQTCATVCVGHIDWHNVAALSKIFEICKHSCCNTKLQILCL